MEIRRDVFQAIADPTRRAIINLVAHQPLNVNAIASNFDMTRQAIALHIKILAECGLIVIKRQGRDSNCEAQFQKLSEVSVWIDQYKMFWTNKLDALENHLESEVKTKKLSKQKSK